MLTLTETATTVISTIVAQSPEIKTGGLRIEGAGTPDDEFRVGIVSAPEVTDSVIEHDGARVFLEPDAAIILNDKVLDAQIDDGGAVRFALTYSA